MGGAGGGGEAQGSGAGCCVVRGLLGVLGMRNWGFVVSTGAFGVGRQDLLYTLVNFGIYLVGWWIKDQ